MDGVKRRRSARWFGPLIGAAVTVACAVWFVASVRGQSGFLAQVDLKTVDLRFLARGAEPADPRVVICAVDQKSVDRIGRWPWPRATLARAIDAVAAAGPRVIALDIAFPLPEENRLREIEGLPLPDDWTPDDRRRWLDERDGDRALAAAIERAGNVVLGYYFLASEREALHLDADEGADWRRRLAVERFKIVHESPGGARTGGILAARGAEPTISVLRRAAAGGGFYNIFSDPDGASRSLPLLIGFEDAYYPSLALSAAAAYLGEDATQVPMRIREYGLEPPALAGREIPADGAGAVALNFRGPAGTIRTVPITDVMDGTADAGSLQDAAVFIGATAVGIGDRAVIPFGRLDFPGTEVQATFVDNLLQGDFLVRPQWALAVELAALLVLGLAIAWTTARLGSAAAPVPAFLALAAIWIGAQAMFNAWRVVVGVVFPVMTVAGVFVVVLTVRMLTEVRAKNQIKRAFSRYLHPAVVERIAAAPEEVVLGGERRRITVLFSDIRGFTKVSADTNAEGVIRLLNDYLDRMTRIILESEGLVDKYIGDAVMAFWGAPERQDDQIERALACAGKMIDGARELSRRWEAEGHDALAIRIGISTGEAIVGNVGSASRVDYTAIGNCVNLASRLEQAGKRYAGPVLVCGGVVAAASGGGFKFEEAGREVLIQGLGETRIFRLITDGCGVGP